MSRRGKGPALKLKDVLMPRSRRPSLGDGREKQMNITQNLGQASTHQKSVVQVNYKMVGWARDYIFTEKMWESVNNGYDLITCYSCLFHNQLGSDIRSDDLNLYLLACSKFVQRNSFA